MLEREGEEDKRDGPASRVRQKLRFGRHDPIPNLAHLIAQSGDIGSPVLRSILNINVDSVASSLPCEFRLLRAHETSSSPFGAYGHARPAVREMVNDVSPS